jgi:3-oxoacyl-[acyl-carrier protein] reductase
MFGTARLSHLWESRAKNSGRSIREEEEKALQAIPAGRLGLPSELGAFAAFLASDQGGFITGQSIRIDGGQGRGV